MRTVKGVKDTIIGIICGNLQSTSNTEVQKATDRIIEFLVEEGNLEIPPVNKKGCALYVDYEKSCMALKKYKESQQTYGPKE